MDTNYGISMNSILRMDILHDARLLAGASGTAKEVQAIADNRVKIPMLGKTESLNASVATGIMLYEYVRQKINK